MKLACPRVCAAIVFGQSDILQRRSKQLACHKRTFVPDQPNLNATSFATSSPNGRTKFIAAPRTKPNSVGGLYRIKGVEEEEGDEDDSLFAS
jgi:hypothetical protein